MWDQLNHPARPCQNEWRCKFSRAGDNRAYSGLRALQSMNVRLRQVKDMRGNSSNEPKSGTIMAQVPCQTASGGRSERKCYEDRIFLATQYPEGTGLDTAIGDLLAQVRACRDNGFHSVWAGQHFLTAPLQMVQTVPLLARLAAEGEDMTFGPAVVLLPMLNPVIVAEEAASSTGSRTATPSSASASVTGAKNSKPWACRSRKGPAAWKKQSPDPSPVDRGPGRPRRRPLQDRRPRRQHPPQTPWRAADLGRWQGARCHPPRRPSG